MKVHELIKWLEKSNPEAIVQYYDVEADTMVEIDFTSLRTALFVDGYKEEDDEDEE